MEHLIEYITRHTSDILVILGAFGIIIEASPKIKINPYSAILKFIGEKMNEETNKRIDDVNKHLQYVEEDLRRSKKKQSRIIISDFANDLRNDIEKSETQFISIMELVNEYLSFNWNSKVRSDAEFIKKIYDGKYQVVRKRG